MHDPLDEKFEVTDTGIIGDMGVALARLRCGQMGHLFRDQPSQDRGIDAEIEIAEGPKATGRILKAQIKCGASFFKRDDGANFKISIDRKHYEYWSNLSVPVVFLLANYKTEECYWALIDEHSTESTGKNSVITIPRTNRFDKAARNLISQIGTPLIEPSTYNIFDTEDVSTGASRRLSYYLALEPREKGWTQPEVEQIIRQVTANARTSRFYRDQVSEVMWKGVPPSVVWVYVYLDKNDRALGRYLVRAIWIDTLLADEFRPIGLDVAPDATGLQIEWNRRFDKPNAILSGHSTGKIAYIQALKALLPTIRELSFQYWRYMFGRDSTWAVAYKLTEDFSPQIAQIESLPTPPAECARIAKQVRALHQELVSAKNIAVGESSDENFRLLAHHAPKRVL